MSKQFETLEAALDLPSLSEIKNEESELAQVSESESIHLDESEDDEISGEVPTMEDVKEALARANTLEQQMEKLNGYDQHDQEMDELAGLAIQAHKDLQDLGMNVEIRHAGEIFSSSSQMLKIAVDAKNLKVDKKLKLLRLQLDKLRIDRAHSSEESNVIDGSVRKMDRNELLKMLRDSDSDDK